jgi:hypothetical protein
MKKVIALEQLEDLNACLTQRLRFKNMFGDKVILTQKLAIKYAEIFDFTWAARNLLYQKDYKKWCTLFNKNSIQIDKGFLQDKEACKQEALLFMKLYKGKKSSYRYIKDRT